MAAASPSATSTGKSNHSSTKGLQLTEDQWLAVGRRLRELRQAKGWAANKVATEVLGLGNNRHAAVTRLERGDSRPTQDQLEKLATAYGERVEQLLKNVLPVEPVREDLVPNAGEDSRHDQEGWTSTRAHASRFVGHR